LEPIATKYRDRIMRMMGVSRGQAVVSDTNVYQVGNREVLQHIDSMVSENLLPGSRVDGADRLYELLAAAEAGEPCLLLLEHYSNFDLPAFHYLLRQEGERGAAVADALLAIAGIKLNETNPVVLAFTEAYTRLVIYPSRSIEIIKNNLKDPKELVAEVMRSTTINRAAMHELARLKKEGKLVLVFPSGTRFRPWDPSTKRGVREIDSYIKSFSKMALVAINGNILRFGSSATAMEDDLICQDRVVYTVGPIIDCDSFREAVKHEHRLRDDKKQAIVDEIMSQLDRIHETAEKDRLAN
jgi:1-acyl-sn-glycerol-3-phosphate acyltransferase